MPRPARLVVPGAPHHVVQRGNRKQALFFDDGDRRAYLKLLGDACARHETRCLAWCLMDNHVHLILVPAGADGLRAPLASAHTTFSQRINHARKLSGHLFQGRFASYAMDDAHLMVAARYIENNPVTAGIVGRADAWPWSSARAHLSRRADGLTDIAALGAQVANWRAMLERGLEAADEDERIARALRSGRPLGGGAWLKALGERLDIPPLPARPERPRK
ncbi:MAG: REP-associated tyrosine transposase [Sphingomonadales bacterium]|jgi:putative transposase|nr:REP-associated tyrosine transposase [Sphingomonadales bacterium]